MQAEARRVRLLAGGLDAGLEGAGVKADGAGAVPGQRAFITSLEKALLDLIYLQQGGDSPHYRRELPGLHLIWSLSGLNTTG